MRLPPMNTWRVCWRLLGWPLLSYPHWARWRRRLPSSLTRWIEAHRFSRRRCLTRTRVRRRWCVIFSDYNEKIMAWHMAWFHSARVRWSWTRSHPCRHFCGHSTASCTRTYPSIRHKGTVTSSLTSRKRCVRLLEWRPVRFSHWVVPMANTLVCAAFVPTTNLASRVTVMFVLFRKVHMAPIQPRRYSLGFV